MRKIKLGSWMATMGLLIVLFTASFTYCNYTDIMTQKEQQETQIQSLKEIQWDFIKTALNQSYVLSKGQSNNVAYNIREELLKEYPDLEKLREDMDSKSPNTKYSKILNNNIRDKFLTLDTDYNDMFIMTSEGIQADKSVISSSEDGKLREWGTEKAITFNTELGLDAKRKLLEGNHNYVFWEVPRDGSPKSNIKQVDLDELKEIFMEEGVDGIKNFVFLVPSHINPKADIFNTPLVNNLGQKQETKQLIIIQEFSIYDQLKANYNVEMLKMEETISISQKVGDEHIKGKVVSSVILTSFFFALFISISLIQNLLIEHKER